MYNNWFRLDSLWNFITNLSYFTIYKTWGLFYHHIDIASGILLFLLYHSRLLALCSHLLEENLFVHFFFAASHLPNHLMLTVESDYCCSTCDYFLHIMTNPLYIDPFCLLTLFILTKEFWKCMGGSQVKASVSLQRRRNRSLHTLSDLYTWICINPRNYS